MLSAILQEPWWLVAWIGWLFAINAAGLLFVSEVEARWVLGALAASALAMWILYQLAGYTRLLGLSHVLFWTPLVVYLYRRLSSLVGPPLFERWMRLLLATNGLSLLIDSVDVLRYLLGDRG